MREGRESTRKTRRIRGCFRAPIALESCGTGSEV